VERYKFDSPAYFYLALTFTRLNSQLAQQILKATGARAHILQLAYGLKGAIHMQLYLT
jgi:hypothetical protein